MNVTLREYREDDVPRIVEAVRESAAELAPWCPWAHAGYTEDEAYTFVRTAREGRGAGVAHEFAVVDASDRYAGACGLNQILVAAGNRRSLRVAEKVGARRDGLLAKRFMLGGAACDAVLYSIVR